MKIQDIIFFLVFIILLTIKHAKYKWHAGVICFLISGVLFLVGNLYTAQRMTWYGAAFIFTYVISLSIPKHKT